MQAMRCIVVAVFSLIVFSLLGLVLMAATAVDTLDTPVLQTRTTTGIRGQVKRPPRAIPESSSYDRCEWIQKLLDDNVAVGAPLPEPGKPRAGGVFWLKEPLLHTRIANDGEEEDVMILRYKIYNKDPSWTQHTDKFTNTVKVLEQFGGSSIGIFPKLYGYCKDIDGFHVLAVEFVDKLMEELDPPETLKECVNRATDVLKLFETLDKKYHMTLVDFKKVSTYVWCTKALAHPCDRLRGSGWQEKMARSCSRMWTTLCQEDQRTRTRIKWSGLNITSRRTTNATSTISIEHGSLTCFQETHILFATQLLGPSSFSTV